MIAVLCRSRFVCALAFALLLDGCASSPPPLPPPTIESFGNFRPSPTIAHFLACPQAYCLEPNEYTELTPIPAERMRFIVKQALDDEPGMQLISSDHEGLRLVYRQTPRFWGNSNTVTVEIVDADEGVSGIVLYSQPDQKLLDWHPNRDQVDRLLAAINDAVKKASAKPGHG
jgi:hypothetical protein